jgi:hypothetical protein
MKIYNQIVDEYFKSHPEAWVEVKRADESIQSVIAREELARLHHTNGIDPSMLECALIKLNKPTIPEQLHDDYQRVYTEHRATGKRGLVREIIVAKTADDSLANDQDHPRE